MTYLKVVFEPETAYFHYLEDKEKNIQAVFNYIWLNEKDVVHAILLVTDSKLGKKFAEKKSKIFLKKTRNYPKKTKSCKKKPKCCLEENNNLS